MAAHIWAEIEARVGIMVASPPMCSVYAVLDCGNEIAAIFGNPGSQVSFHPLIRFHRAISVTTVTRGIHGRNEKSTQTHHTQLSHRKVNGATDGALVADTFSSSSCNGGVDAVASCGGTRIGRARLVALIARGAHGTGGRRTGESPGCGHGQGFASYLEGHGTSSESKKDSEWVLNSTMAGVSSDMAVDKSFLEISILSRMPRCTTTEPKQNGIGGVNLLKQNARSIPM
ncbi:hypothetical protein PCH_Pc20g06890 [Penicillium rubens Wisconsin 54-1255]|uniref:Uncharacterized protein n=1 Tax=Penicillium rubens (strain ATCC 28089 / DSM 1075 / NRRL 1951 / Wisconsin 54-1255) TaxID=500485 RepID=B6HDB4_PENRW|nr:hypothetical protein PCH_Pc20g06890 [Penicillium rubens Wisconsin 54-1255]